MKDDRGVYYYPSPQNKQVRMYVRHDQGEVCFRLWHAEDPQLWVRHGWVPYDAIKQASAMYHKGGFDPDKAYDIAVANAVLRENP